MKKYIYFSFLLFLIILPTRIKAQTTAIVDITEMNIYQIQDAVDKGYLTYEQITRIYLDRINKYNKQYNAILTVNKNIIAEAKEKDEEYQSSGRKSLIFGLPILVKDNIDVKGMPTTSGSRLLIDSYPNKNSDVVQKLLDAGAIIIGKTNMSTFALDGASSYSDFGHVHNAYNLNYTPYGSSGGSAVAVAANFAVAAIGTDTGVSLRLPSAANNVIGFRTTYNLVKSKGVIHLDSTRDVIGPITKYVEDNAIIMEIIDDEKINYQSATTTKNLKGIRIGVIKSFRNTTVKSINDLFSKQLEILKNLGAEIVYIDNFNLDYSFLYDEFCYDFNNYIKGTSSHIKSFNDLLVSNSYNSLNKYSNSYCTKDYHNSSKYKKYIEIQSKNIEKANNIYEKNKLDAILYVSIKNPIVQIQNLGKVFVKTDSSKMANLIGFPAMAIPIGNINQLYYGMEIMAEPYNESIIYDIAFNLQRKNSFYKVPDIAPKLYTVSESAKQMLQLKELIRDIEKNFLSFIYRIKKVL